MKASFTAAGAAAAAASATAPTATGATATASAAGGASPSPKKPPPGDCFKCGGKGHWSKDCTAISESDYSDSHHRYPYCLWKLSGSHPCELRVGFAPTNRATCRGARCGQKITKDSLRISATNLDTVVEDNDHGGPQICSYIWYVLSSGLDWSRRHTSWDGII